MASTERQSSGPTRRERRRAQKEPQKEQGARPVEAEPSSDEDEAEASDEPAEEAVEQRPAERIKDRNRRLRAEAAERRQARRDVQDRSRTAQGLDTAEMVDDVFSRFTHTSWQWVRQNSGFVQGVIVVAVVGGVSFKAYSWNKARKNEAASSLLFKAVQAQQGIVLRPEEPLPEEISELRRTFASDTELTKAAREGYDSALSIQNPNLAALASIGLAGALFGEGKFDEALARYSELKTAPLAAKDPDFKGRVLEGIAMALEGKDDREGALKAYRELENAEIPGFSELSLYHQARLLVAQGELEKAKELISKVRDKLKENKDLPSGSYLRQVSLSLLRVVDPSAPSADAMDPERLKEILEQLKKQAGQGAPPGEPRPGEPGPGEPGPIPDSPTEERPGEERPEGTQ